MSVLGLSFIALGYLIGSIPFGLIITKLVTKKDITKEGSGNIGATNVVRTVGKKLGALTLALDAVKGIVAVYLAIRFGLQDALTLNLIGLSAIIGHCFPVWLKFKGGKGVATLLGILFFYDPVLTIFLMLGWYIVFYVTRIVAMASVIVMIVISAYFILKLKLAFVGFIIAPMIVIYRHKENISRILSGKEHSF